MAKSHLLFASLAGAPLALLLSCSGSQNPSAVIVTPAHTDEVEKWRERRLTNLRKEDGWLTLVGLFWLQEGENRFGSDPSNRVVLTEGKAPAAMGSIDLSKGRALVRVDAGVSVLHKGQPVQTRPLVSDADGEPTVLEHGTLRFYLIRRGERFGVRVKDTESQARREFRGIEIFPVSSKWQVEARLEPYGPGKRLAIPNVLGTPTQEESPGAVVFEIGGRAYRLDAVRESGSDELFLIFGDQTNGHETYGGGRFLYADPSGPEGKVVVDFNKAYNPPCVFTPYATCPLPPPQNRLPVRIEAGEKTYGEH